MNSERKIPRRDFILASTAFIPLAATNLFADDCRTSETNIMGPAHRAGAPARQNLCEPGEPGVQMTIAGTVLASGDCRPIGGATLDIWQTNAKSDYDMESARFHLRGKIIAGKDGKYRFDTVMPGEYGDRAKHIHYLVSHPGFEPLITQCYFEGDDRTKTDRNAKPPLVIKLRSYVHPVQAQKYLTGDFNVVLEKERHVSEDIVKAYPSYVGQYLLAAPKIRIAISKSGEKLRWHADGLPPGEPTDGEFLANSATRFFLREFDSYISFVKDESSSVTHLLNESNGAIFKKVS